MVKKFEFRSGHGKGFVVGDITLAAPPMDEHGLLNLCMTIAQSLPKKIPTELETYWYVVEQYDRLISHGGAAVKEVLFRTPLFEIEHSGRRSETSYVGKPNPGVIFIDQEVMPALETAYGSEVALRLRATIFVIFCESFQLLILPLRARYAQYLHDICVSNGQFDEADKWAVVVSALKTSTQ